MRKLGIIHIGFTIVLLLCFSCDSGGAKEQGKPIVAKASQSPDPVVRSESVTCTQPAQAGGEVFYRGDGGVANDVVATSCISCHNGSNSDTPAIDKYSTESRRLVESVLVSGKVSQHASLVLTTSQQSLLQAWYFGGGRLGDASSVSADPDSLPVVDATKLSQFAACDFTKGVISETDTLLRPTGFKTCQSQGKVYDHFAKSCHQATFETAWCNKPGITEHFSKTESTFSEMLADVESQGYRIDQCGVLDGNRIVYLVRTSGQSTSTVIEAKWYPSSNAAFGFQRP